MNGSPKIGSVPSHLDAPGSQAAFSGGAVEMIAAVLRTIGDPTRIRPIEALNEQGSTTGSGLADRLRLTQQAVPKQLGVLHHAGIVGEDVPLVVELCDGGPGVTIMRSRP